MLGNRKKHIEELKKELKGAKTKKEKHEIMQEIEALKKASNRAKIRENSWLIA